MLPQLHTMKLFPKSRDTAGIQLRKIHLARGLCQQCQGARLNRPGDFTKSPVHGPPIWTQFDFSNVSVITYNYWLVLPRGCDSEGYATFKGPKTVNGTIAGTVYVL